MALTQAVSWETVGKSIDPAMMLANETSGGAEMSIRRDGRIISPPEAVAKANCTNCTCNSRGAGDAFTKNGRFGESAAGV